MTPPESFMRTVDDVLARLRGEYLEMPGLRLKPEQAQRLCGIEPHVCQIVLDELVKAQFLCLKSDGHYARLSDGDLPRSHSVTAVLRTSLQAKKAS